MNSVLESARAAGSPMIYTASQAARHLCRPVGQILRAIRSIGLPARRAGDGKSAALLLSPDDLRRIDDFLNNQQN